MSGVTCHHPPQPNCTSGDLSIYGKELSDIPTCHLKVGETFSHVFDEAGYFVFYALEEQSDPPKPDAHFDPPLKMGHFPKDPYTPTPPVTAIKDGVLLMIYADAADPYKVITYLSLLVIDKKKPAPPPDGGK